MGGAHTLTLYGASARPAGVATALAAFALERSVRAKRTGAVESGLFALAAWLKPNVLGLGAGAMASQLAAPLRVVLGCGSVSAVVAAHLQGASRGQAWHHLAAATLQPLVLEQWAEQIVSRAPFFAAPIAFALLCGVAGRGDAGVRIASLGLATSLAWTLVSLAKIGSASCYWMEPCLGAVVVCAPTRPSPPRPAVGDGPGDRCAPAGALDGRGARSGAAPSRSSPPQRRPARSGSCAPRSTSSPAR